MSKLMNIRTAVAAAVVAAVLVGAGSTANLSAFAATKKPTPIPTVTKTVTSTVTATPTPVVDPNKYSVALIGDMPYDALGVAQTPNVINEINASGVDLVTFDGDTMSGKGDKCTDENYIRIKSDFFDKFSKPIVYSIGDNEWVDCDRPVKGSYDPLNRLNLVRSTYFQDAKGNYITLGTGKLAGVTITHNPVYPELQMFTYKKITYIIPHIPGSANNAAVTAPFKTYNDLATDGDNSEYTSRDAANQAWIAKGFDKAIADGSNGVIVVAQANMDWEGYLAGLASPNTEYTAAYDADKLALLTGTLKFKKPVLLQNGDEHWYQLDMPMNETAGKLVQKDKGSLVENFTRVQTFGSGFNHWVELTIDPSNPNLWSFTPHIVKANVATH